MTSASMTSGSANSTSSFSKAPLIAGLMLGLLIVGWSFVMGITGWYLDPQSFHLFWVAVALQALVLTVTLMRTRQGRSYGEQVGIGLATSAVASILVFVGSLLFTAIVFPHYFADLRDAQRTELLSRGMNEDQVVKVLEETAPSRTPGGQAFAGFMGTLGTGFVVSLVAAAFLRERRRD